MPIKPIALQRRHAELGRIRLGAKQATSNGGTRPAKLECFRFTSPSERYITDLATLYGGDARPWDNDGKAEYEVYTDAKAIPVIAVKGGLTQWLEHWSGGGCQRRCDGELETLSGRPCICDTEQRDRICKPTTRLSVMLPELEAIGVWRMESKGWNAAAEIPAVAELAQYVGDLVPAHLNLVERRAIKDGKTSRFVVPVLDLQIGTARLKEIVAEKSGGALPATGQQQALEQQPQRQAIEAGPSASTWLEEAQRIGTVDGVRDVWRRAAAAGFLTDALKASLTELVGTLQQPTATPAPGQAEEPVDAELVADQPAAPQDADTVWQQILAVAGDLGADLATVTRDFEQRMALAPAEASAGELQTYLQQLRIDGLDVEAVPA